MVFDYYISTAFAEHNIHFDIYYRKTHEFVHLKGVDILTAFQSMTLYGIQIRENFHVGKDSHTSLAVI